MNTESEVFLDMYPFTSNWFDSPGGRMHYLDEGRGRTLVMLHGNPSWSFLYRNLVKSLRDSYRIIAPDHIGMGLSDKPQYYSYTLQNHIINLELLLEEVLPENEKITLVMHDWGGAIGMGLAVRRPDLIERLVVFNTSGFLSQRIPLRIDLCRIPLLGSLLVRGFNAFAGAAVHMAVAKKMSPEVAQGFVMPYGNWHDRVATIRFVQDIPMHPGIPSYETMLDIDQCLAIFQELPVLIQWGGKDWCFNDAFYHEWRRRFPEAQYDYYPEAGHYLLEDASEEIIPRVSRFLHETDGALA